MEKFTFLFTHVNYIDTKAKTFHAQHKMKFIKSKIFWEESGENAGKNDNNFFSDTITIIWSAFFSENLFHGKTNFVILRKRRYFHFGICIVNIEYETVTKIWFPRGKKEHLPDIFFFGFFFGHWEWLCHVPTRHACQEWIDVKTVVEE